jgi:hypothetical protein
MNAVDALKASAAKWQSLSADQKAEWNNKSKQQH